MKDVAISESIPGRVFYKLQGVVIGESREKEVIFLFKNGNLQFAPFSYFQINLKQEKAITCSREFSSRDFLQTNLLNLAWGVVPYVIAYSETQPGFDLFVLTGRESPRMVVRHFACLLLGLKNYHAYIFESLAELVRHTKNNPHTGKEVILTESEKAA